jgi:uridylate kinase
MNEAVKLGRKIVLVAGGGETARKYIGVGRDLGMDESSLDNVGIGASRLNAEILIGAVGATAFPSVPHTLDNVVLALRSSDIVCCGGFHPGHSTNAVAALIAERTFAELLINSTDVDGVFSSDPRVDKKAKLLEKIEASKLSQMLGDDTMSAGTYNLMDPLALKIIQRSKIPTLICKCNAESLRRALSLQEVGTRILV